MQKTLTFIFWPCGSYHNSVYLYVFNWQAGYVPPRQKSWFSNSGPPLTSGNDVLLQDRVKSRSQAIRTWWLHQMETISALLAICAGNSPVPGEFPAQRPVTRSFDVLFDLRLNKQLRKQSWGWYLGRYRAHYDVIVMIYTFLISPKLDRNLGSSATETPVEFRSDTIIITFNLGYSRLHEIWW